MVETGEAAAEDIEEDFEVGGAAWTVDDGEGAAAKGRVHLAAGIAVRARVLDDDGGRRFREASEKVEEAGAGFFGIGAGLVEREAQVDDGDVDRGGAEDFGSLTGGVGPEGADAHGFEKAGQAVGPGVGLPAGVGEEEVQAASGGSRRTGGIRREPVRWEEVAARNLHHVGTVATGMPGCEPEMGEERGKLGGIWAGMGDGRGGYAASELRWRVFDCQSGRGRCAAARVRRWGGLFVYYRTWTQ